MRMPYRMKGVDHIHCVGNILSRYHLSLEYVVHIQPEAAQIKHFNCYLHVTIYIALLNVIIFHEL